MASEPVGRGEVFCNSVAPALLRGRLGFTAGRPNRWGTVANVLRLGLVAEGVETEAQALFLRAIGVEKGQGWLWGHELDAAGLASALGA